MFSKLWARRIFIPRVRIYIIESLAGLDSNNMPRRDDLEHKALHYIANTQNEGVLQADLWRKLGASSEKAPE